MAFMFDNVINKAKTQYNNSNNMSNIQNAIMGGMVPSVGNPTTSTSNMSNIQNSIMNQSNGTFNPSNYINTQNQSNNISTSGVPNSNTPIQSAPSNTNNTNTQTTPPPPPPQYTPNPLEEENKRLTAERDQLKSTYEADKAARDKSYNDMLEAKRAAVRAAIQKAQGRFQEQIQNAPQQFQDKRNDVVIQEAQNLQNIRRSLANLGYNPDSYVTRQERQDITTDSRNEVNQLDLAQEQIIREAQNNISQLEAQGNIEDANAVAEIANQKMAALDNLKANFMNQTNTYNQQIGNNIKGLMEWQQGQKDRETQATQWNKTFESGEKWRNKEFDSNEYWKNKTYDAQQAQQTWDNKFKDKSFNYQTERDKVADSQFGKQYQLQLDKFAWEKNPDNPMIKSQIIDNNIKDLELSLKKDPNSPQNQMIDTQLKSAKQQLAQLMAITPEMTVKEFNMKLDQIKANIDQGWKQLEISQQNANTNEAARKDARNNNNDLKRQAMEDKNDQAVISGMERRWITKDPVGNVTVNYDGVKRDLQTMKKNGVPDNKLKDYANYFGIITE